MYSVAFILAGLAGAGLCCAATEAEWSGKFVDENNAPLAGVRISVVPARTDASPGESYTAVSNQSGAFSLRVRQGNYRLDAERTDFFALRDYEVRITELAEPLELTLFRVRQTSESVDVSATLTPLDLEQTGSETRVTGRQLQNIPYPATRSFRNSLRVIPGVVQDQSGGLHFDGGMENQVFYTLDGFNIGDPVTGRFSSRLTVESVRSVEFSSGRYSPEFGKGSAGTLAIQTTNGDDKLRYTATNFFPGIETRKGLHIGTWSPRFNLSGPIRKGRAWFSESIDAEYNQTIVPDLPKGQDRTTRTRGGSVFHGQVNVTSANILTFDFLGSYETAPHFGLGALDPISTSIDRLSRQWFGGIKDQIYFGSGTLLEIGLAETRISSREEPQGSDFYIITPNGRRGNAFTDSKQTSRRDQLLANLFLPSFEFAGSHQLKTGIDLDLIDFRQQARRTGFENYGYTGQLLRRTTFGGSGSLRLSNREASSYVLDVWRVRQNLTLEYGLRQDWDSLVRRVAYSPRFAFAYAPLRWTRTKLTGGYAVIHDASNLALFSRPLDQYTLATSFGANGEIEEGPVKTVFRRSGRRLLSPRYQNWSFGFEQILPANFRLNVSLLRRRGVNGFTYLSQEDNLFGEHVLTNRRNDVYDSAAVTLNHAFGKEYGWMASYTRSRSLSTAVIDISVDQPIRVRDNFGPVSWDAPNRLLSWGFLPTWSEKWAIAYLCDYRTGFPFSVVRQTGEIVGAPNSRRFPQNFELNLHLERKIRLRQFRFAIRGGINNLTNNMNPTGVNSVLESPNFLTYYGRPGRHAVFRLRWLSRE